jgi:hypothetical protein
MSKNKCNPIKSLVEWEMTRIIYASGIECCFIGTENVLVVLVLFGDVSGGLKGIRNGATSTRISLQKVWRWRESLHATSTRRERFKSTNSFIWYPPLWLVKEREIEELAIGGNMEERDFSISRFGKASY